MNKKEMAERLSAVIQALNSIEVRGKANMTSMVGCIQLLEKVSADLGADMDADK